MCERIVDAVGALRAAVAALDPSRLAGGDAARLVDVFAEGERLCQAGRALAAGRALETREWRGSGHRTPAQWLAARTRTSLGRAISAVETAHRLTDLPATREAFRNGLLSETQAAEITAAAAADPAAERTLLQTAEQETVAALRERCREVRAAALSDPDVVERIRRARYLRHWTDREGAVRLDARLAPDDGARLLATVTARADRLHAQARRRSGEREPAEAYAADALVSLADGEPGPRAVVHVEIDHSALARGHALPGETCRIPGVGPVPVTTAKRLASDAIVKVIETDGVDVRRVAHLGRTIPAHVRTALEARDPTCVVPGCDARRGLEIDHLVPFADGGPTRLDNLARLCRYHHAQKTHHGRRLGGKPGAWTWTRGPRPPARATGPPRARAP